MVNRKKRKKIFFRNTFKQEAFDAYVGRNKHDVQEFNNIWKESMKNARRIFNFGKHKDFRNLSERSKVFTIEEIDYGNNSINKLIENGSGDFYDRYNSAFKNIYEIRTKNFFKKNGMNTYKDTSRPILDNNGNQEYEKDKNGNYILDSKGNKIPAFEKKTLNEWFNDYKKGSIDKDKMNEIIEQYKEQNPDRDQNYSSSNPSDEDINKYFEM